MPPRNTIGVPTILLRHAVKDPETRRALDALAQETTRWLQRIAEATDTTAGLRGEPTFYANVNAKDNRLTKVGVPKDDTDATLKGLALGRSTLNATYWDAKNLPIRNLPSIDGDKPDATLSQEQIRELIKQMVRDALDVAITTGTFTATGAGFVAAPTGTARYAKVQDLVLLFLPELSGTSNATSFTITGMPAVITPTQTSNHVVTVTDTTTDIYSLLRLTASSTTITMLSALQADGLWGSTGTKSLYAVMVAYHLA